ncbi:MAG: FHA domain-containing protein [Myxococcales bacterium]|nr:FHA domain-containing protein [Myxococcales bacterium]
MSGSKSPGSKALGSKAPDSESGSDVSRDSERTETSSPRRAETISIGGVAPARSESQRTIMPVSIRKHAYLSIVGGSRKYAEVELESDITTIGRGPDVDFVLEEPSASRQHVSITRTAAGHVLRDLGSTNGTYLMGVLNDEERFLEDDDCFRIGGTEIVYHAARRGD